jgi:hypothetical protein
MPSPFSTDMAIPFQYLVLKRGLESVQKVDYLVVLCEAYKIKMFEGPNRRPERGGVNGSR